jgi:hypothetical protein
VKRHSFSPSQLTAAAAFMLMLLLPTTLITPPVSAADGTRVISVDDEPTVSLDPVLEESKLVEVPALPGPTSGSKLINGLLGGTLQVGRFTLVVPPLAFSGSATISINVPDPSQMKVELNIWPASANHFRLPVVLSSNVAGVDVSLISKLETVWWDEEDGKWCPVNGSAVNVAGLTVYAPLYHFSTYGVQGKAGW